MLISILSVDLTADAQSSRRKRAAQVEEENILPEPSGEERASAALGALQRYLVKGDYKSAFPLVKVMADKGFLSYQVYLAGMYMNGQGTGKDPKQAAEWYQVAAQRGSKEAQARLGRMYFNGEGVPKDYKQALKWLEATAGNPKSALLLGRIYSDGLGTERNYARAIDAFKVADGRGTDTKIIIGILYSLGGFGVEKNFTQARKWLEASAAQKNALAQCALGFVYYEGGHGLEKDVEKAKQCIRVSKPILVKKAAEGNPAAQAWLGKINYLGLFQEKNYMVARKYFEASGDADSVYMLGVMQKKGQGGLKKDFKKAMELFQRADALGAFQAKVAIGELHYLGQGFCEAKKWFEKAAKNNDPVARYYLGCMHANGECMKQDLVRAKMFFQLAGPGLELAKATNEDCVGYLKHLNTDLLHLATVPAAAAASSSQQTPDSTTADTGTADGAAQRPNDGSASDTTAAAPPKPARDFKDVAGELESLVIEYYPRAKIARDDRSVHFEFKVKELKLPSTEKKILVPQAEGIVGDLAITPGRYAGPEYLPLQTNETYYVSLLMAPYSTPGDCHVLTRLFFPPNTSVDFVNRFKQVVNSFQ